MDDAALDMIRRADPVPAPPPLIAEERLVFRLQANFGWADLTGNR